MKSIAILTLFFLVSFYAQAQLINGSLIVSEINFNSDSSTNSGDWFELYNTSTNPVDLTDWRVRDMSMSNFFNFPDNTVITGNAYLVVVNDVAQFTARYPGVSNYVGQMNFNFGNAGDQIRLFDDDNVLQYSVTYDDTLAWPRGADGEGRTLELANYSANPNDGNNWFDGCMFGSPGVAYQPCDPPLLFSEINYNSDTLHDSDDWLELYNRSGAAIELTGWKLKDSKDSNVFAFPTLTIPDGAYLVICNDEQKFETVHPTVTNKIGDLGFSLSNGGETIRLFNQQNVLQFSVRYNDVIPWPQEADGGGYTLELIDEAGKVNEPSNWIACTFLGSPGEDYSLPCSDNVSTISNTPATLVSTIEGHAYTVQTNRSDLHYTLYDIQGKRLGGGALNNGSTLINLQNFSSGIYMLRVGNAGAFKLVRY